MHPAKYKKLSHPFEPQNYKYFDYQNAWVNALTFQNNVGKHLWIFLWRKQLAYEFPQWFLLQWWPVYSNKVDIIPSPVLEAYNYFCQKYSNQHYIPIFVLIFP